MDNVFKPRLPVVEDQQARSAIVVMAQQMGPGQRANLLCPSCSGGHTRERSMSLNVEVNGVIKYHCHRTACNFSGTAYAQPGLKATIDPRAINGHINPLTGDLYPLNKVEIEWFKQRFNVSYVEEIRRTVARYALPIYAPNGSTRGWITRRPWDGSPADTEVNRNDSQYAMKALTYMESDAPVMSWYTPPQDRDIDVGCVLVEDQISALRLAEWLEHSSRSLTGQVVALLGTGLNASKIAEIQRSLTNHSRVVFALDRDATGHAFAMARKWGQAFSECRVVVLSKDIKDCTDEEIGELPL
jgi:hypothetical protein